MLATSQAPGLPVSHLLTGLTADVSHAAGKAGQLSPTSVTVEARSAKPEDGHVVVLSPRASLICGALEVERLPPPLEALATGLEAAFTRTRTALGVPIDYQQSSASFAPLDGSVRSLMADYLRCCCTPEAGADWRAYASFNPHHYIRHLLAANDDFELILICWGPGQVSRVHNHDASHCWLTCLEGAVEERHFAILPTSRRNTGNVHPTAELPGTESIEQVCPELKLTHTSLLTEGGTGYINDGICLHSVGCGPDVLSPGAVTLHLYSPPIRKVKLYEPEEGRVVTRVPGFFTVRGHRT